MERLGLKIKYLYHSGFSVETDNHMLIFDYYQGFVNLKDKKTYVFSSHSHGDHYNPEIFSWRKQRPNIRYILSSDISGEASIPPEKDKITFISPYEEKQIDDIKIKAYGSTDLGVSFLVKCNGKNIFHAGDLNWWYWPDDTPEEKKQGEEWFKKEIAEIKGESIDIAFFPVDPRLEENYCLGGEFFIKEIKPRYFVPMHLWDDQQIVRKFKEQMRDNPTQIIELIQKGQEVIKLISYRM